MKKIVSLILLAALPLAGLAAQSDDDLFGDDGIDIVDDISSKGDLSKGIIFDSGTVKVGGSLDSSITTNTVLYSAEDKSFKENFKNSMLTPKLSGLLSVDARPTETLRMYTKFGFGYPFNKDNEWFKLKELFTDFSVKDTAFFRFGIHTVTWGTGYFASPVSDMINTTSIDPENPDEQVDGAFNLRAQIVFPNTQNCLWFYVIPSTNFQNQTAESYVRETAFAGKADVVLGDWEFGVGGFFKYQNAPKAMLTATGSIDNVNVFAEAVYGYGAASEWAADTSWKNKTNIVQATAGFSYTWEVPSITLAGQYYFDGNDKDFPNKFIIGGHNIFANLSFGKIFGTKDVTANIFAMANFGRKEMSDADIAGAKAMGVTDEQINGFGQSLTTNAMIYYSPMNEFKVGMGPSLSFKDFDSKPTVSLKLMAKLGGGNF